MKKPLKDVMNAEVETISPASTAQAAADKMRSLELSVLPVCQDRKLLGVVTDREMTVHVAAVARDSGTTLVKDIMSPHLAVLWEEDDIKAAERVMEEKGTHWVFVTDADRNLVGMLSLGKIARTDNEKAAGKVVKGISRSRKRVG
jgi:CBS domain-containing protein